ncbi:MAG: carboxy terminal-processing peptidase [Saprospiraceae bacterium]|nr:carboxy terminal-processing peptidase [Saprospiraceae bacterium]
MKRKGLLFSGLIASLFLLTAVISTPNSAEKESLILNIMLSVMDQIHFEPKDLDDDFSKQAFERYLNSLDGARRYLIQSEVDQLKAYQYKLDDEAEKRSTAFFDLSMDLIETGMSRTKAIYQELMAGSFDLDKQEDLELDGEKRGYAKNEAALKDYWRKYIKYQIVLKSERKIAEQAKYKEGVEKQTEEEIVADAFTETKKLFDDWFDRIGRLRRSDRFEAYLNAYTHIFDPHSSYLSPKDKADFDMDMGGRLEGIGARLVQNGDFVKISSLIPGGPAWKGKELEVDDIILQVTQKGEKAVDVLGMRVDDVAQIVRGKKGTVVILTVKKKDGTTEDIRIERDEVILDESFARSVMVDLNDDITDIGYIKLPKFYSTFDGGNSCAADIKTEIEKLEAQNAKGIILDLRDNLGGSLPDVVDMSGLFIEKGPIVQVKSRDKDPYVYRDKDPEVAYDGPLIVMVNALSASASEILAAALQDYKRAVIVGGNSTYGKATVQRFIDLDRVIRGASDVKPLGTVKLTYQKFYRINGTSNQLRGVVPDIILPDQYTNMDVGEKEYDNALSWSEVEPVNYYQDVCKLPNLEALKVNSAKRIAANPTFDLIQENNMRRKRNAERSAFPLDLDDYVAYREGRAEEAKKYGSIMKADVQGLQIENLPVDVAYIKEDESRVARNEDWIKTLKKDIYLEETLHIMQDLIKATK